MKKMSTNNSNKTISITSQTKKTSGTPLLPVQPNIKQASNSNLTKISPLPSSEKIEKKPSGIASDIKSKNSQ